MDAQLAGNDHTGRAAATTRHKYYDLIAQLTFKAAAAACLSEFEQKEPRMSNTRTVQPSHQSMAGWAAFEDYNQS
jgi:hypothetical protein